MKNSLNSLTIQRIQTTVGDIKDKLTSHSDLNIEKDSILKMIEQVDYLVGKHDDYCEQINVMLTSMVEFDFSKRLSSCEENDNNLINVISQGLNMVNEELDEKAMNKNIVKSMLDMLANTKLILATDNKNNIIFAHGRQLPGLKEDDLKGKSISTLFDHYELIVHLMRVESLSNNINMNMLWKGQTIPVSIKLGMSMKLTKIEGIIYIIDLPENLNK